MCVYIYTGIVDKNSTDKNRKKKSNSPENVYIYIHTCIHTFMCVYNCVYLNQQTYVCNKKIYIYIYVYIHIIYIHIYSSAAFSESEQNGCPRFICLPPMLPKTRILAAAVAVAAAAAVVVVAVVVEAVVVVVVVVGLGFRV